VDCRAEDLPDQISEWADLSVLIEHFSFFASYDWLFRGVADASHTLRPKIGRKEARKLKRQPGSEKPIRVAYRHEDERAILSMFKQQARAYLDYQPTEELEWLAVAQHFGLPTRLLDWTNGLFVAAWFAVERAGEARKKSDSAIWVTKGVSSIVPDHTTDPFDLDTPRIYRPPHVDRRISAQGSVLMVCPNPTENVVLPFSKRIVIKRSAEFIIRKRLHACGINRSYLFPGLGGLAEHLAWVYKYDWLAGYREQTISQPN